MLIFEDNMEKDMITVDNEEYNFIHKDGENYFDSKTIASLFGISRQDVVYHVNRYLERNTIFAKDLCINLKTGKKGREKRLYSFDVITYIAYRIDTEEAIIYRSWVAQALNEKFNKIFEIEELPAAMSMIGSDIIDRKNNSNGLLT